MDRTKLRLYAVTDRAWAADGDSFFRQVAAAVAGGADIVQLREKHLDPQAFLTEAKRFVALCREQGALSIINDSAEIAAQAGADGVHVGQSDLRGRDIRALIGPDRILGISAGTVAEAKAAQEAGADYIGVGAVFGTSTKKDARNLTVEALRDIVRAVSIPVVAIGGINAGNIAQLKGSNVDGVAVISAIFGAEDPGAATSQLLALAKDMVAAHG